MRYDDTVILIELFLLPTIPLFRLLSRDTWIHKKQRHSAFKISLDRMFIYGKSNADMVSKYSATIIAKSHYRYKEEIMVMVLYFSGLFIYSYKIYIHPSNFALAIFNKYFFFLIHTILYFTLCFFWWSIQNNMHYMWYFFSISNFKLHLNR